MLPKKGSLEKIAMASFLAGFFLLGQPTLAKAGCGCDKPPPTPAAVIPGVAFPGMTVTLFDNKLVEGQTWDVVFQSGSTTATVSASVVSKRDITDSTGTKYTPQLVVNVPGIPIGPTSILASTENDSLVVPQESFTVIAKPLMVSEQTTEFEVENYTTAVGYDGTLYISVGWLTNVCKAMDFKGFMTKYPLRFANGDIIIFNSQGYLIDSLGKESADHFFIEPPKEGGEKSDYVRYLRHSFETYCADHLPGGDKEVDPADPNWHLDGTPHVDHSALILAIAGHFDDGSVPQVGSASFNLVVETEISDDDEEWEDEEEENVGDEGGKGDKEDKDDKDK
jgi:hypothetical protein